MFDKFEWQGIQVSMDVAIIIAILGSVFAIFKHFKDNKEKLENENLRDLRHRIEFVKENIENIDQLINQMYLIILSAKGRDSYSAEQIKQLHEVHINIWSYFNRLKLKLAINNLDAIYMDAEMAIEKYRIAAEAGKPIVMFVEAKSVLELMVKSCSNENIATRYLRDRFGALD